MATTFDSDARVTTRFRAPTRLDHLIVANNGIVAMERHRTVYVNFTEEEAYELLMRCMSNDEDDNSTFQTALEKLATAIKGDQQMAA